MNAILLATTLFAPHAYKTLDPFNLSQSISLADALKKYDKQYKLIIYPGGGHLLVNYADDINKQVLAWFVAHS